MAIPVEQPRKYSLSEYFHKEIDSLERHEYRNGEIVLMAGGSPDHSLILAAVMRHIANRLEGKPCRVYEGNLRIRVGKTVLYTYPDASIICGPRKVDPDDPTGQTVLNPKALIEVLSPSTEAYDRGEKFGRYRQIESLEEYILVSQVTARIETFYRQPDGTWIFDAASELTAKARLRSLGIELPLADVYAGVEFPPPPVEPMPG